MLYKSAVWKLWSHKFVPLTVPSLKHRSEKKQTKKNPKTFDPPIWENVMRIAQE